MSITTPKITTKLHSDAEYAEAAQRVWKAAQEFTNALSQAKQLGLKVKITDGQGESVIYNLPVVKYICLTETTYYAAKTI
jgi:hypothetical protein